MFFRKPKKIPENKREYVRVPSRNLIKITKLDGTEVEKVSNIFDLSESGARMICYEKLPVNSVLTMLMLFSEEGSAITVEAKVVWAEPLKEKNASYFTGVVFIHTSESNTRLIRRFLSALSGSNP